MSENHSVTFWIDRLKQGEPEAAQRIWQRYFQQLLQLARRKLSSRLRRAADEEDVVQEAFASFFRAAENGRFPHLHDRDNLWRILFAVTERKARDLHKHETRQKRGGGEVVSASALAGPGDQQAAALDAMAGREPSPEFAAELADEFERQLARLQPREQQVALLKLEGRTIGEIASHLQCSTRSVDRLLEIIRTQWLQEEGA